MSTCARLVCAITLLAAPAAAQSTTEDGVRAVLRGDYPAAVRILRPLADSTTRPDPVAQFFLAVLYDTGSGVVRDEGRACSLFLRAAKGTNPFLEQSAAVGESMREQLGDGAPFVCVAEERWQGGPPQSFALGPNHCVVFADTNITVTYGDQEQRTTILLPPGAVFLPVKYTPLTFTRAGLTRHFFEWFSWRPNTTASPSSWTLDWTLSEVVRDQWIGITGQSLAVVNGPTRPASYDVSSLVRLRVNASGEAEFSTAGGDAPRTEVIPLKGNR